MATKARSPNYPAFSLQKAVDFARKVYEANHLHKASPEVVARALGYGGMNGKSATAISALKKFGLLEEDKDELKVTADALTIIVEPPSSPERARALVKLATKPALFSELAEAYPGSPPSEEILRSWLLRRGFLQSTVDLPIRAYRDTMDLAEAQKSLYTESGSGGGGKVSPKPDGGTDEFPPEVGDLIQWEASGILQMEAPRRVRGKQEHEGSWWVFVEGSETGIPMEEAVVVERKAPDPAVKQAPPSLALTAAARIEAPQQGELEVSRGKLGKGASGVTYRLLATGDLGSKELGKLIKLLKTQKAILDDDEEDEEEEED